MDESELRLDGNAFAGLLREIFVQDLTGARGACASCGAVGHVGAQHLYDYPDGPGAVLRCSSCENILMVLVRAGTRYRMGTQCFHWMGIEATAEIEAEPKPAEEPVTAEERPQAEEQPKGETPPGPQQQV